MQEELIQTDELDAQFYYSHLRPSDEEFKIATDGLYDSLAYPKSSLQVVGTVNNLINQERGVDHLYNGGLVTKKGKDVIPPITISQIEAAEKVISFFVAVKNPTIQNLPSEEIESTMIGLLLRKTQIISSSTEQYISNINRQLQEYDLCQNNPTTLDILQTLNQYVSDSYARLVTSFTLRDSKKEIVWSMLGYFASIILLVGYCNSFPYSVNYGNTYRTYT